jgi:hypothetical protein
MPVHPAPGHPRPCLRAAFAGRLRPRALLAARSGGRRRVGDHDRGEAVQIPSGGDRGGEVGGRPHLVVTARDQHERAGDPLDRDRRRGDGGGIDGGEARGVEPAIRGWIGVGLPFKEERDGGQGLATPRPVGGPPVIAVPRPDVGGRCERDGRRHPVVERRDEQTGFRTEGRAHEREPVALGSEQVERVDDKLEWYAVRPRLLARATEPPDREHRRALAGDDGRTLAVDPAARAGEQQHARPAAHFRAEQAPLRVGQLHEVSRRGPR